MTNKKKIDNVVGIREKSKVIFMWYGPAQYYLLYFENKTGFEDSAYTKSLFTSTGKIIKR